MELIQGLINGDRRHLSRLLSQVESLEAIQKKELWTAFLQKKSHPLTLGIVGTPGAGKSTFLNTFLTYAAKNYPEKKIGLLLIDPSGPLSGGALLGDRVRMADHYLNNNFFIRSISNKGDVSGLNPHLSEYLMTFLLYPFDIIMVESVGGGQATTDLVRLVNSSLLIYDPSGGDSIQHLKSGILEVIDHVIISKEDLNSNLTVKESLKEWNREGLDIWSANLQDANTLKDFFEKIIFSYQNKKEMNKIILSMIEDSIKAEIQGKIKEFMQKNLSRKVTNYTEMEELSKEVKEFINQ